MKARGSIRAWDAAKERAFFLGGVLRKESSTRDSWSRSRREDPERKGKRKKGSGGGRKEGKPTGKKKDIVL